MAIGFLLKGRSFSREHVELWSKNSGLPNSRIRMRFRNECLLLEETRVKNFGPGREIQISPKPFARTLLKGRKEGLANPSLKAFLILEKGV